MTPIGYHLPPEPGQELNDLSWDTPSPVLNENLIERVVIEARVGLSGVSWKADLSVRGRLLPSLQPHTYREALSMSQDTSIVLTATTRPGDVVRISAPTGEAADTIRALLAEHPAILDVTCHPDVAASTTTYRPKYGANAGTRWRRRSGESARRDPMADEVRAAATGLFREVDDLHYEHGWPNAFEYEERAYEAVGRARELLSRDKAMTVDAMLKALKPVMDAWWPEFPLIAGARAAVDRIRNAAITVQWAARTCPGGEAQPERRAA